MQSTLTPYVERIQRAYGELGHHLGWRFLNGPARTLSPEARVAFVGLNPGGDVFHPPVASVEAGFAYRVERWGTRGTLNPLQVQVHALYAALSKKLVASAEELMDDTLAWNFCPFRSPAWEALVNRERSLRFSQRLCVSIFELAQPRAILCLGGVVDRQLEIALRSGGARRLGSKNCPAGWGTVSVGLTRYESRRGSAMVVRLPHLSRYAIFGRPASAAVIERMTEEVAQAISD